MATEADQPRRQLSPEHRARISAALKGRRQSPEHAANAAAAKTGRARGPLSPEHRANVSAALRGRKHTPETRAKIAAAQTGRKLSAETRAKISAAKKGRPGRPQSPEARAKISAAKKGSTASPEARAKMSAAHKGRRVVKRELNDEFEAFLAQHRARRPEPATSPDARSHTLRLGDPRRPTYIDGVEVKPLTVSQHAIVRAVVAAGLRGLTEGEIRRESSHGGGATTLRRLRDRHPKWAEIIRFPGRPHGRIRIDAEIES
jgi:hypothetical protein